ncbi:MAG: hypothetical protein ACTHW1_06175 [Ancrocorticia sp.]|uniref:hypothetical protein n=1 Tax=Ancrocorticia sp. TaxID=2593684 RepID=UPI003F8F2752
MSRITIAGNISSALTHFAMLGVAAIADSLGNERSAVGWTESDSPRAYIEFEGASEEDIASEVIALALRVKQDWSGETITFDGTEFSPISPRIKQLGHERWPTHHAARLDIIDQLAKDKRWLETEFIGALGEPAYWREQNGQPQPDQGASRWEMKTRNKGEEFIRHRFDKLAVEISQWTSQQVLDGISGKQINDVLGKNQENSRSSTGFTRPGPTDNALAWTALWGITQFPIVRRIGHQSITPGAWPKRGVHPHWMILPVLQGPVTLARYANIISSRYVDAEADEITQTLDDGRPDSDHENAGAAADWLQARGVAGFACFKVKTAGSASAPERQVLEGQVRAL